MSAETPGDRRRTVAVTGATGFIGRALVESLQRDGYEVLKVVRGQSARHAGEVGWDPAEGRIDAAALEGVQAAVHLAGESIDGRWTAARKRRIRDSRIAGTRLLAETLAALPEPPEVLISGSAVGYYGMDRGEERLDETSSPGSDYLSLVAVEWESAAEPAEKASIRVVHPRFGLVLDRDGGALARMLPVFRLGGGGRLGSGRQWMSWVTRDDAVRAIRFAIDTPALRGAVNVVAPEPVTNADFTAALGRAVNRPAVVAVPEVALHVAFGEMADATLLASQRAYPGRLLAAGFEFRHPDIDGALAAVVSSHA